MIVHSRSPESNMINILPQSWLAGISRPHDEVDDDDDNHGGLRICEESN